VESQYKVNKVNSKERVVRVAPNISPTAGHYGHLFVMLVGSWIAQALGGRLIVRIDWSIKTRGSLHDDASPAERRARNVGFRRLLRLAKYCGASEVIDEFGVRHSLDGIIRNPVYRVLPEPGERMPIAYYYDADTLTDEGFIRFLKEFRGSYSRTMSAPKELPLIAEQTHVRCSRFPREWIKDLIELCAKTGEPPRRFYKAYCHLEMDRLLGVTDIVRGFDAHSERIRKVHEAEIQRRWGLSLPKLYRVPLLMFHGQKISSSEEDGVVGLYPKSCCDVKRLIRAVIVDRYLDKVIPTLDKKWFRELLTSEDPLLDAPIWKNPLELPEYLAQR
jgi:hypothetical protein